jgi:hypothetical protein
MERAMRNFIANRQDMHTSDDSAGIFATISMLSLLYDEVTKKEHGDTCVDKQTLIMY